MYHVLLMCVSILSLLKHVVHNVIVGDHAVNVVFAFCSVITFAEIKDIQRFTGSHKILLTVSEIGWRLKFT